VAKNSRPQTTQRKFDRAAGELMRPSIDPFTKSLRVLCKRTP
jgi:hypothetical protein